MAVLLGCPRVHSEKATTITITITITYYALRISWCITYYISRFRQRQCPMSNVRLSEPRRTASSDTLLRATTTLCADRAKTT